MINSSAAPASPRRAAPNGSQPADGAPLARITQPVRRTLLALGSGAVAAAAGVLLTAAG